MKKPMLNRIKKITALCLALLLPLAVLAAQQAPLISLEGLTLEQLQTLRRQVDARIRELQLPAKPLAAPPYAATREDPAPLGITATYQPSYWSGYAGFDIQMLSSSRGNAAQKQAKGMTTYNVVPLKTQEYFIIHLRVKALAAPNGRAQIGNEDFRFVSASGAEYPHYFLINNPQPLRTLYQGEELEALIACHVDKGDTPLVVFQPQSPGALWFNPNPQVGK